MTPITKLFRLILPAVKDTLKTAHLQHIQVFPYKGKDGTIGIKLVSIDCGNTPETKQAYKDRVLNLIDRDYCESLERVYTTATTAYYKAF